MHKRVRPTRSKVIHVHGLFKLKLDPAEDKNLSISKIICKIFDILAWTSFKFQITSYRDVNQRILKVKNHLNQV